MGKTNKTFSVTDEYNEIFEERRKELGMTVTAYFEHLIDTEHKKSVAATPVEVVKDNPEHLTTIDNLNSEISLLKKEIAGLETNSAELEEEKDKLYREIQLLEGRKFATENDTLLQIDPLNVKVLTYVAIREGNKRKQEWSISDVVNWFIHYRFVCGTLNGGFDSVPDRIINQLRKEIEDDNE
jgi:hypothetical protein